MHYMWPYDGGFYDLTDRPMRAQEWSDALAQALARIEQARGAARSAGSSLLPQLSGSGSAATRASDGGSSRESADIGLSASYALDIWGRYRNQASAARFSLDATTFDGETTALLVQSQVAATYFTILAVKDQIAIAEESLAAARGTGDQPLPLGPPAQAFPDGKAFQS